MDKEKEHILLLQELSIKGSLRYDFFVGKTISEFIFPDLGDISSFVFNSTKFSNVIFKDISFYGANLDNAVFENCCFENGSLAKSNMYKAHFKNCIFYKVSFRNTRLNSSLIEQCVFSNVSFENSIISNSTIENCLMIDFVGDPILNENRENNVFWK